GGAILRDQAYPETGWCLGTRWGAVLHEAMSRFEELFRTVDRPVGDHFPPDRRGKLFPGVLAQSQRLRPWVAGQPAPRGGRYLLIGVVTWSGYDMALLDRI